MQQNTEVILWKMIKFRDSESFYWTFTKKIKYMYLTCKKRLLQKYRIVQSGSYINKLCSWKRGNVYFMMFIYQNSNLIPSFHSVLVSNMSWLIHCHYNDWKSFCCITPLGNIPCSRMWIVFFCLFFFLPKNEAEFSRWCLITMVHSCSYSQTHNNHCLFLPNVSKHDLLSVFFLSPVIMLCFPVFPTHGAVHNTLRYERYLINGFA